MIRELDTIVLNEDIPDRGLKAGDLGAVVLIHPGALSYEVEFVTLEGETLALVTLKPAQVRPVGRHEIAHVRTVSA